MSAAQDNCRRALSDQPGHPQADRGGKRLDQGGGRDGADEVPLPRPGGLDVQLEGGGLQLDPAAAAARDCPECARRPGQRLSNTGKWMKLPLQTEKSARKRRTFGVAEGFFSSLI